MPEPKELRNYIGSESYNHSLAKDLEKQPILGKGGQSKCYIPARFVLCIWSFWGFVNMFTMRMDLNVALLAMAPVMTMSNDSAPKTINDSVGLQAQTQLLCNDGGSGQVMGCNLNSSAGPVFNWTTSQKDNLLSAFFYGYSTTQILGGILSKHFGAKLVLGFGMLWTSALTLVSPIAAQQSYYLIFACRVLQGLGQGISQPCMHTLWSNWAPEREKSKLMTITYSGCQLGTVAATLLTAYICSWSEAGGWPVAFYVYGSMGVVWSVGWMFVAYDTPERHPRISFEEKTYIEEHVKKDNATNVSKPPWCKVLISPCLLAILAAHFANDWGCFALTTCLPTYMDEILNFKIKENGFLSSLPFIMLLFTNPLSGFLADMMISKNKLNTKNTRKLMNSIGLFTPAVLMLGVCVLDLNRSLIVTFLTLAVGMSGFTMAGYSINHMDIAPSFAGILYGITNTVGTTSGFLGPNFLNLLNKGSQAHTAREWKIFFYLTSAIFFIGGLMFLLFAQGDPQHWGVKDSEQNQRPTSAPTGRSKSRSNSIPNYHSVQAEDGNIDGGRSSGGGSGSSGSSSGSGSGDSDSLASNDQERYDKDIDEYIQRRKSQRYEAPSSFLAVMQSF